MWMIWTLKIRWLCFNFCCQKKQTNIKSPLPVTLSTLSQFTDFVLRWYLLLRWRRLAITSITSVDYMDLENPLQFLLSEKTNQRKQTNKYQVTDLYLPHYRHFANSQTLFWDDTYYWEEEGWPLPGSQVWIIWALKIRWLWAAYTWSLRVSFSRCWLSLGYVVLLSAFTKGCWKIYDSDPAGTPKYR